MISNETYQSYLLRFWRDGTDSNWRASLKPTDEDETLIFIELNDLFDFLAARLLTIDHQGKQNNQNQEELR